MTKSVCGGSLGPSRRHHPPPRCPWLLRTSGGGRGRRPDASTGSARTVNSYFIPRTSCFLCLTSYLLPLTSFSISIGATVPKPAEVVTRGAPEVRPCLSSSPPCPGGGAAAPARAGRAPERFVRRPAARDCGVRRREPRRRDDEPGRRCSDSERAHCSTDAPAHAERHSLAASDPAAHA